MYARIASFEGGDEERLRQMGEERRDSGTTGMPEGAKGMMLLADRDKGRRLFITFFEDRAAIDAAEQQFDAMGDEIPEEVRGRRTSVDVYEVLMQEDI